MRISGVTNIEGKGFELRKEESSFIETGKYCGVADNGVNNGGHDEDDKCTGNDNKIRMIMMRTVYSNEMGSHERGMVTNYAIS